MRAFILGLLILAGLAGAQSQAGGKAPTAFVAEIALGRKDAEAGASVVRDGTEVAARLMMPLFAGDTVFLRDPASRIDLELADGSQVSVKNGPTRYAVSGPGGAADSGWDVIAAIGGVFAGEGEQAPENMVSKGGTVKLAMAVRGPNYLRPRDTLWLAWEGGKAPYAVSIETGGLEQMLADGLREGEAKVSLRSGGKALPARFTLVVRDAERQAAKVRVRMAGGLPQVAGGGQPATLRDSLLLAARLTAADDGVWSLEAAQVLAENGSDAAMALARKVAQGWRYAAKP